MEEIHFEIATDNELEWVAQLKSQVEREYIEPHFGWDEEKQKAILSKEWAIVKPWLIVSGSEKIGTVSFQLGKQGVYLGSFYIVPQYQRLGIGSRVLTRICERLDREGQLCELAFLKGNPVHSLYARFGFTCCKSTKYLVYMRRLPKKR
ncbi:GNAT family N-acetyltransferase [Parasalinivibrio latis]|uniref:GNAT family N-acetyltransferase n=1 Tax=Parasalinivibrio latis TaxID=2952610 RepID=UPI0030E11AC6